METGTFSKMHHVGVICKDIDKTIAFLNSIGLGPFKGRGDAPWGEAAFKGELHGKPAEWKTKISNAQVGDLQIELLEPSEGAQALKESLDATGDGLHHVGYLSDDIDKDTEMLVKKGLKVWTSARMAPGRGFVYFEPTKIGGVCIELRSR